MTYARPADYWLSDTAIYIQLNAAGDPNFIHANCSAGSMVMCYMRGIDGLGYDNAHNYRRWSLIASPTVFHDDNPRYVYIAIPKKSTADAVAQVVFPSEPIDIYGKNASNEQLGSTDYYFIDTQGVISASRVDGAICQRTWLHDIVCGTLASDEALAAGGEGSWWIWNAATDMVKFLKTISEAVFQKISATFAEFTQIILGGRQLNSVASDDIESPTSETADDAVVTPAYASGHYLSKTHDDIARGTLTFNNGIRVGDFIQGAKGAAVDPAGNSEFESIVSRSYLKVFELIYNRLNAQEGNTSFADVGTIDEFIDNGNGTHSLVMRRRWDGDFTAFQPGDIVYGYVNELISGGSYYKAWAWVGSVDRANNILIVHPYPDSECPGSVNHPLTANMLISRWGNIIAPNETTHNNPDYSSFILVRTKDGITKYINSRQQSFFISCDEGNIVELMDVDKPILERWNYGAVLGQLPAGLIPTEKAGLINEGQPYLYARGIVVQDLIRIDYNGRPLQEEAYRGLWSLATAQSADYYQHTDTRYDTVTHNGRLWQCIANGNTDEPSDTTGSWLAMTNDTHAHMRVWTILPSAYLVSIRQGENGHAEIIPEKLSCKVRMEGTDGCGLYDDTLSLLLAGAKLFYSLDGNTWYEFVMGEQEPLELEDGSGYLEAESSTADSRDYLTVGGDDVDTENIADRIFFELQDANNGDVLATAIVPIVKDGVSYAGTIEMYAWSDSKTSCPTKDSGVWSTLIPPRPDDPRFRFLWNYEIIMYSNGERNETEPHCTSMDGKEIVDFVESYMATDSDTPPSADNAEWADNASLSNAKPYLWNKEIVMYSDGSNSDPIIRLIAQKGEDGKSYEYIYKVTSEYNAPAVPADVSQIDDFVPVGWEDDPPQTDADNRYCWMVYRKRIDGVWSPFIGSADRPGKAFLWTLYGEGQGVYAAIVYRRSNASLTSNPPVGGDYEHPVPDGWSSGIPDGDERVWCSTRIFTSDGEAPQQPAWSTPRPMTDTADFDVEYSSVEDPGTPGNPNPGGVNSNPNWHNDPDEDNIWMATNVRRNGVWSGWKVSRIRGLDGISPNTSFKSYVFCRQNSRPSTPTGGSYANPVPAGWSDGIPSGEQIVWCSTRIFSSDGKAPQQSAWTTPQSMTDTADLDVEFSAAANPNPPSGHPNTNPQWSNISNEDTIWMAVARKQNGVWGDWTIARIKGEKGDDGTSISIRGELSSPDQLPSSPTNPSDCYIINSNLWVWDGDSWVNAGRFQGEKGDSAYVHIKYANSSTVNDWTANDGETPGAYIGIYVDSNPVDQLDWSLYSWMKWQGEDGFGYEYIYRLTVTNTAPVAPTNVSQDDDYVPSGWSDDPIDVSAARPYCWVCYRKKVNGVWSSFIGSASDRTHAALWAKYGKDGDKGDDGEPGADGLGISVSLSRDSFLFRVGHAEIEQRVYVDVFVNGSRIDYRSSSDDQSGFKYSCTMLNGSGPSILTNGIYWSYGVENNRFYYSFIYNGIDIEAFDVAPRIVVFLDGNEISSVERTISFRTVADGRAGLMAYPAGEYDINFTYSSTAQTSPVVFCNGEYYILKDGKTYTGNTMDADRNTPEKDYVNGGSNSAWRLMERFNSIFTDIIMAEFAKLSKAVFYGDWMISQQGLLNDGNGSMIPSDEYQHFKDGSFRPNFSVNFLTGEMRAKGGIFDGSLRSSLKCIADSDATVDVSTGVILLHNDLYIMANGGNETLVLPVETQFVGARATICDPCFYYSRTSSGTAVMAADGKNILGIENATNGTIGNGELAFGVSGFWFTGGIVELLCANVSPDDSDPDIRWFVINKNAYMFQS